MAKMVCPICGEKFDEDDVAFLDNGNPACPNCVEVEQKQEEKENEDGRESNYKK